ncbi:hypothetical protein V5F34_17975 [Xanthobacter autotrophicus]|uniref:hypothetical protein n=1 Tax=Xanthobacter autotrophicus TaxID=280 RepID=UPI0037281C4E
MPTTKTSLFASLLRTVADWASSRHGPPKQSARTERRRRARQRLKDRAVLADFFRDRCQDLGAQVDALRQMVDGLNMDRERLQQQIQIHHECMEDLGRRNAYLLDQCATSQHEAEHWKRFAEGERAQEAEIARKFQLN